MSQRIKTEAGAEIRQRRSFPEEVLADLNAGVPVKVYYDLSDPSHLVFEKDSPSWIPIIGGIGIGAAALLFL